MPQVIREMSGSFSGMEGEVEYRIDFEVDSPGCSAQTCGPPENCYPAEGPEWHITCIEQAVYLEDRSEPKWVDIRQTCSPEEIAHIESWAEGLDLSEECIQDAEDQHIAWEEHKADMRDER